MVQLRPVVLLLVEFYMKFWLRFRFKNLVEIGPLVVKYLMSSLFCQRICTVPSGSSDTHTDTVAPNCFVKPICTVASRCIVTSRYTVMSSCSVALDVQLHPVVLSHIYVSVQHLYSTSMYSRVQLLYSTSMYSRVQLLYSTSMCSHVWLLYSTSMYSCVAKNIHQPRYRWLLPNSGHRHRGWCAFFSPPVVYISQVG